jgi:hypothetical protein
VWFYWTVGPPLPYEAPFVDDFRKQAEGKYLTCEIGNDGTVKTPEEWAKDGYDIEFHWDPKNEENWRDSSIPLVLHHWRCNAGGCAALKHSSNDPVFTPHDYVPFDTKSKVKNMVKLWKKDHLLHHMFEFEDDCISHLRETVDKDMVSLLETSLHGVQRQIKTRVDGHLEKLWHTMGEWASERGLPGSQAYTEAMTRFEKQSYNI